MALSPGSPAADEPDRLPTARFLRVAGEAVLLALVVLAPWPYASNDQPFELALSAAVLLLAALWAAHAAMVGRLVLGIDIASVCLAGLCLWSAVQLIPLPESIVGTLCPDRLAWHRELLPEQSEVLPGEAGPTPRATSLSISVNPAATRTFTVQVLGLLVVYLAARSWLASRASFRRLAWALILNGVALAVFAFGQFFSAPPGVIYWSVPVEGVGVFGPFVCRNHYVDYAALCAGLGFGLLLPRAGDQLTLLTARGLGLIAMLGLVLASIPFSLSRGGVLAVVVAAVGMGLIARRGGRRPGGTIGVAAGLGVAAGVAIWLGPGAVESRLDTLGSSAASRLPLWSDTMQLIPGTWPTGTGAGTFQFVEPTVRTGGSAHVVYENAHNEYLEALVEGGVIRLLLTLGLVAGVLFVVGRGAVRRRDRSVGPLLLGAWFGLAVGALHAFVDFGIHMPAVAVATVVVAGYAMAGAMDPAFLPRGESARVGSSPREVRGPAAGLTGLLIAGAALVVALDARFRDLEERLRIDAESAYWADDPDRHARRIELAEARAKMRPFHPDTLFYAAQAHLDAAIAATWTPGAALAGGAAGFEATPARFPPAIAQRHLVPALRYLREARAANPLDARPHARLGLYAGTFTGEPAAVHFNRAKRLLPADPDIWFTSGREGARRGDFDAAWSDWRHALGLSPQHLPAVLAAVGERLSPVELASRLPDDPIVQMGAAGQFAPAERRPFAESAAQWARRADATAEQLAAAADACEMLGRTADAERAWQMMLERAPDRPDLRSRFSAWLEREERYEEAIPHLEWLRKHYPDDSTIRDRLDAARHGLKLQRVIAGRKESP